jgi:putative exosortase-associated protein (TIGR04073 family)
MKKVLLLSAFMCAFAVMEPAPATADQQPDMIVEKMAIKLTQGLTNTVTSVIELPKQTILTTRDMGAVGLVIGPIKGFGMTFYRGVVGIAETIFCLVPQPGYYDPILSPEYVWQGWEPKRETAKTAAEEK